ncbi:MAG: hypothetical protein PHI96_03630 [Desulfovibrio sp.]|nr:hypothetical protein [Desulfovibrio sp.]
MITTPLTIKSHGNTIMLYESIELMAQGLRETYLDHGLKSGDDTAGHSLYAGLDMIAASAARLDAKLDEFRPISTKTP